MNAIEPAVSDLTRPWWNASREGRLLLPKCKDCGQHHFRPEVACTHCFSLNWDWVESSGRATLYSFSEIHRAPVPGFRTPAVFAIVELEEGVAMFSNIVECPPEQLRIDMPLQVVFEAITAEFTLPKFRPAESARTKS
jgi:uncharacterized OB-fold protein